MSSAATLRGGSPESPPSGSCRRSSASGVSRASSSSWRHRRHPARRPGCPGRHRLADCAAFGTLLPEPAARRKVALVAGVGSLGALRNVMGDALDIAVIGSGVSGLTAAHVLGRRHRVTLYERDERLGGHANTVAVRGEGGHEVGLDTGFIVHNERTYPHPASAVRRPGRAHAGVGHELLGPLRGLRPRVRGSARNAGRDAAGVRARPAAIPADAGRGAALPPPRARRPRATRPPTG